MAAASEKLGACCRSGDGSNLSKFRGPLDTEPAGAAVDPDSVPGRKALDAKDWNATIKSLSSAAHGATPPIRYPKLPGIRLSQGGEARSRVYAVTPTSKRSRWTRAIAERTNNIGEAYLMKGDLKNPERHRAAPREICRLPCEELTDLEREIASYVKKSPARNSR